MLRWLDDRWTQLSLSRQFMVVSFVVLVLGMSAVGWWIERQIESVVINRTAATTALYVESLVSPAVQDLAERGQLPQEARVTLDRLLLGTALGRELGAFKLWSSEGRILYSMEPAAVGDVFEPTSELERAWRGSLVAGISNLEDEENVLERGRQERLLEIYTPIRLRDSTRVIAVAEFYHSVESLQAEIGASQTRSRVIVGVAGVAMYLFLARLVARASGTIVRQQRRLEDSVAALTALVTENRALNERVRRAAASAGASNERYLRRVSAELHDGPAQELGLALLRLDSVIARTSGPADSSGCDAAGDLEMIQACLQNAMQEVRSIAGGLRLPELESLTPAEIVTRAVRTHERRTATKVTLRYDELPTYAALPVKITLYRIVQEALTNAYRHADGVGQHVHAGLEDGSIRVEIGDAGPGLDGKPIDENGEHLGLIGMRERVESLGGLFHVESSPGAGTHIIAHLPPLVEGVTHEHQD